MADILGIRVKLQVIPPPGERDPDSITKQHQHCKHHVNYSSKVRYIQHKTIINLNHPVTLAMTDGPHLPHSISTLCQEYFDLKSSDDGTIIHVFVCIESASCRPLAGVTYIKRRSLSLPRLATAPLHGGTGTGWKRDIPTVPSSASWIVSNWMPLIMHMTLHMILLQCPWTPCLLEMTKTNSSTKLKKNLEVTYLTTTKTIYIIWG